MKMLTRIAVLSSIVGLVSVADITGKTLLIETSMLPTYSKGFQWQGPLSILPTISLPQRARVSVRTGSVWKTIVFSSSDLVNWEDHG